MSSIDHQKNRSEELEKIRSGLRGQLDKCRRMKNRFDFEIEYETNVFLSPPEERALIRQIEASHGDDFRVSLSFGMKRHRRKPSTTIVVLTAKRRQRKSRRQE